MKLYRGIVVDNKDPLKAFRVKVRISSVHSDNISDNDLPYAEVMSSTTFGLNKGVGISSVLQIGTWVWVVFENDNTQKPIIIGVVTGEGDLYDTLNNDNNYANVQSWSTKSGHSIIISDVKNDESITINHRAGSQIVIDKDGNIYIKGVKDANIEINNNLNFDIGQNVNFECSNMQVNTDSLIVNCPNSDFSGNVTAALVKGNADVFGGGKSLKNHTHTAPHGQTTPPN